MKVAILYICTGKYNQFFPDFYQSCEKFFLKGIADVEYFVFTDNINLSKQSNVHLIQKECRGFPLDSLFRFEMFLSIEDRLRCFDYCFFFNANMLFVAPIGQEFIPIKEKLMAVTHPGFYRRPSFLYPYERNRKSTAYIRPFKSSYKYFMGSLNGGKTEDYLELVKICAQNTREDYQNGIIALVHDESHLNKYLSETNCLALSPAYAYPEDWNLPFEPKLILRDKVKLDKYFNKGRNHSFWGKLQKALKMCIRAFRWYIKL